MTKAASVAAAGPWKNRIVGHGEESPAALIANPANWRTHPPSQQKAMTGALDAVGWVGQVLVNRTTGHLVDGHLRVEMARQRDEPMVPVTYVELSEAEERLVLASLDPIGALADVDGTKLAELLTSLDGLDAGLQSLLDDLADHNRLRMPGLADPDDTPPVPEPADVYVKPGELWRLGDHRLIVGDATDPAVVERVLDGARPRLLVTDPPYGVELDQTWRDGVYNKPGRLGRKAYLAEPPYMRTAGSLNTEISGDTIADWSPAFALVPSLEVAFVWHAALHAVEVAKGLASLDFEIRSQIIWAKTQFAMSRSAFHWQHEPAWYAVRKGCTAEWLGDHSLSTVWQLASPKQIMGGSTETKFDHPTQKPCEAMERPIASHRGDVYEPFLGSGTTLIAAERLRRRCYGIEIEPRYAQLAIERWRQFTGREAVRG